jgi:hypothetical protein
MTMGEVTEFIERFAKVSGAPVQTGANVTSVRRTDDGYHLTTSRGEIRCRAVVIASGACNQPAVPQFKDAVPGSVEQLTPFGYRDPAQLPGGGVRFAPTRVPGSARLQLDLRSGEIRAIVWATGFRPDYGWLDVPVVDAKGLLRHEGRCGRQPGTVRAGTAHAAAAQVHVHLRYRGRCA